MLADRILGELVHEALPSVMRKVIAHAFADEAFAVRLQSDRQPI